MRSDREAFIASLDRKTGGFSRSEQRLGLAVSGGPDSLALLLLAQHALPGRIAAATVDHGLRAEAADEARYVAEVCAARGIAHNILTPSRPIAGNIQSQAREARYALLDAWATRENCDWIATAHHADDQLETLLMRLARGSGVAGMAGIRGVNGRIVRPLLDFTKQDLERICALCGVEPVRDPSNEDPAYDRVRMRAALDALGGANAPAISAVRTAEALAQANDALDWTTERCAAEAVRIKEGVVTFDPAAFPPEIRRRLVVHCLAHYGVEPPTRAGTMGRVLAALDTGGNIVAGGILCEGGETWRFSKAPERSDGANPRLDIPGDSG